MEASRQALSGEPCVGRNGGLVRMGGPRKFLLTFLIRSDGDAVYGGQGRARIAESARE